MSDTCSLKTAYKRLRYGGMILEKVEIYPGDHELGLPDIDIRTNGKLTGIQAPDQVYHQWNQVLYLVEYTCKQKSNNDI